MSAPSNGSVRRLNSFGTRRVTNGSNQTASVPASAVAASGKAMAPLPRGGWEPPTFGNAVANPFPCRTGKLREKIFRGVRRSENHAESWGWDGCAVIIGGLAGKRQGRPNLCDFRKLIIHHGLVYGYPMPESKRDSP